MKLAVVAVEVMAFAALVLIGASSPIVRGRVIAILGAALIGGVIALIIADGRPWL